MSKKLLALFLVLGLIAYAEDTNTVASDTTTTESSAEENVATTEVTKQVTSENNQQLDVKEIDTEDLILQNQNLESSSVNKNPDEYILYRLGQANEKENNLKMALTDYKAVYSKNGKLANDAMLRAAEIYDKQENVAEAEKLFTKLYAVKNNKDLKAYSIEKLIYYKLVKNNTKEAKKLYDELKKLDAKRAEKFKAYF